MRLHRRRSLWAQIWYHDLFTQYCVLASFTLTFILILWAVMWYDPCGAGQITTHLCEQYDEGLAAGDLCYKICREKSVYLARCMTQENGMKRFSFLNLWLKVPASLSLPEPSHHSHKKIPTDGSTIEQFHGILLAFLNAKLGRGDHSELIRYLLMFADFNQDQQISLAEARSLWSLLQSHDFLMLFVFRDSRDYFLKLNGTCGGLYAVEQVPHTQLYQKEDTYMGGIFPTSYLWGQPSWNYRANIAVGFLDFIFTVYEKDGIFYNLCEMSPLNLGYTAQYDFRVLDLTHVFSGRLLKHKIQKNCSVDSDCVFSPHCSTICDTLTWQCSSVLRKPNLSLACAVLRDYILPDAPRSIHFELGRLLTKCQSLDNHTAGQDVQHMVLLNELFTLIFDQIKFSHDRFL